ncbi:MAG TPA: hypothetical protein VMN76_10880 [Acidobacteriota bacterium]|nr:hypothetical protein [Acidobacteriota bacterium]
MSMTTLVIILLAIAVLIGTLVATLGGFRSRAKDPKHTRRPGDFIRSRWP